jgi:hypothetical protein
MFRKNILSLVAASVLFVAASPLQAVMYPLVIFNDTALASDPGLEFAINVLEGDTGQVNFTIQNTSIIDSTIARVYFDGGFLASIADIINGTGTNFSADASPGDLPAGNEIGFEADFSASANPPPAQNGIDPGESVTVIFNLLGSHTFSEIIGQLDSGAMRVGAHIISVGCSEVSVSSVNVPEPATIALLGLGSLILMKKRSGK